MMKIETFEDMEVWQRARELVRDIYSVSNQGHFAQDWTLRDQIRRATISIMSNVAEGFERSGNREFIRFLYSSKASAAEARSQLYIAFDLDYLDEATFQALKGKLSSISRQLSAFIKYLEQHPRSTS